MLLRRAIVVLVLEVSELVPCPGRRRLLPRNLGGRVLHWLLMRGTHVHMLHSLGDRLNYRLGLGKTLELVNKALVHLR